MRLALLIGQAITTLLPITGLADVAVLRDPPTRRPLVPVALVASIVLAIAVAVTG